MWYVEKLIDTGDLPEPGTRGGAQLFTILHSSRLKKLSQYRPKNYLRAQCAYANWK